MSMPGFAAEASLHKSWWSYRGGTSSGANVPPSIVFQQDCRSQCDSQYQQYLSNCVCPPGLTNCNGVCTDLRFDGSNCGACGHACTGRSSGLAGARRHSSASMDNASVKVSAAIRMRPAIALNVRYHLHTVLERRAGGSRDWMHVSPDARRLAPGPKNCEGPGDAAAGSHLEACVRNDVTEESLFLVT